MATPRIRSAIEELESSSAASKSSLYTELLDGIISTSSPDTIVPNLTAYLDSLLGDSVGLVTSRPLLQVFVEKFRTIQDPDVRIAVGQHALQRIASKVVSYEDPDTSIKLILADAFEEKEEFSASAKVLQTVTLDSTQRAISVNDKGKIWIRIVRCYLEEDDATSATGCLNRIKNIIHDITDKEVKLNFQLSQARIFDSERSFLEASTAYHTFSFDTNIDEDERLQALSAAIICAVLGPAGPLRARTLGRLYKDDRATQVEEFGILEKMFLDRLLAPAEVAAFAKNLRPHQLARTSDGSTVLDKAVLEHNLLGVSKLYANIGIDQLGELLGIDADRAESYAAQMMEQGRLAGYIDQIDRFIFFRGEGSGERSKGQGDAVVGLDVRKWDANVQSLAEEVERIATMIQANHADFYAANMVH
ncbi:COP9 signalosome-like protein complex subunit 4 [Trichodelitschia bisporula]|uniref:COP9 signalosome complex subunit 4 n=1 Tax=Trichodelitschia bisporula TaxID=703511 RepID=A0A6G1IAB9_9PEZI|nr:COP9 signalosome-like protein complex subunit 4 [Trichodelitschia bisporula]